MTSISKSVSIDKLDDIVNKYNNTYHNIFKPKPVDIFAKGYSSNWSQEVTIKNVKNTVPSTYIINDLNERKNCWNFFPKKLYKTNQKELRIEQVIKKNGDKLHLQWKG